MEIDPRFKQAKAKARRRQSKIRRYMVPVICGLSVIVGIGWMVWSGVLTFGPVEPAHPTVAEVEVYDPVTYALPFVDVAGDPMTIKLDIANAGANVRTIATPVGISSTRVPADLLLVSDRMIALDERFIATLPSSREDFAFFQMQRDTSPVSQISGQPDVSASSSTLTVLPEDARTTPYSDVFVRLNTDRSVIEFLVDNGVSGANAATFLPPDSEIGGLNTGQVAALRYVGTGPETAPVQLSVYDNGEYLTSLAASPDGGSTQSADAWVADDLVAFSQGEPENVEVSSRQYRLIDAFYSAAIRNGVPSSVVGQAIVLLSQAFDMERFAGPEDRMTVLFSSAAGDASQGVGRILYMQIDHGKNKFQCYVYRTGNDDYKCFSKAGGSNSARALRSGMQTPVQGVVLAGFGPQRNPLTQQIEQHTGVSWAAPQGTPVTAAFDGVVESAAEDGDLGYTIRLKHDSGRQTTYGHLSGFSKLGRAGRSVTAGDVIGYVGDTGAALDTYLFFEFRENGIPVDPFDSAHEEIVSGGGSGAVDVLVNKIIRVESAGNARAKNPLSSATGLGQFIESTWIRMMKTYRPDLASSMSRAELLDLRFDPTLSREMVTNLARENEAYLVARGHEITAGRLYLCHFLGGGGAHVVLSNPLDADLLTILGAGVIKANPFLTGKDGAYIRQWAERKMRPRGAKSSTIVVEVPSLSPDLAAYLNVIENALQGV